MALNSEVSPPIVGDPHKDRGDDIKSEENDSSQSTDDDVDLEEGEILDEEEEEEEKDFTNSSLKEALDKSCLQNIEQLVNQAKKAKIISSPDHSKISSPRKMQKMVANYIDPDRNENPSDHEDGWVPKFRPKLEEKPIDYRMELAAYRGTPPSSPDQKRRDKESRKKKSSKKSKKTRKTIKRKDVKGMRVLKYKKEGAKGRICKFFKEGKCAKGSDCMFSHPSPQSFKKRELCKFYLNGHCNKGKECLYMHNEFPCKFYHTGSECYARDDCRFSHAPLTDEMKRVLADYLRMSHGDDVRLDRDDHERGRERERDRDRKRRMSRSPEPKPAPPKRTCLLGSPPRHIREAEETRIWQEEMKLLQSQNHPGFEIHLCPDRGNMSPPQFTKPNFYNETLLNTPSPQKKQGSKDNLYQGNSVDGYNQGSPSKVYVYDEDEFIEIEIPPPVIKQEQSEEFHWEKMCTADENRLKPFNDNLRPDLDFTNDVKFDETTQFSEMESSTDGPPALSPDAGNHSALYRDNRDYEDNASQESCKAIEEKPLDDLNADLSQEPPAPDIIVPSHLPRKQQELLMRVLQHQRKNSTADVCKSPAGGDNTEVNVKKEEPDPEVEEKSQLTKSETKWYSSEDDDDDDDTDNPLTEVLKKIQQAPPSQPQNQESKPKVDIMDMFHKIQQKTLEKNKGMSNVQQPSQQGSFWANILNVATSKPASSLPSNPVNSEQKRRTLLPNPVLLPTKKMEQPAPKEPLAIKDPRLKNRDPRKLAGSVNTMVGIPKLNTVERNNAVDNSPSIHDTNSLSVKPITSVANETTKENIPYRLRGISANPPNYTPYISASQSNPNLLKDPRIRKHLLPPPNEESSLGNGKDHEVTKPKSAKDVPPIPELLLKYQKPATAINIFESSKTPVENSPQEPKSTPPHKIYDPRMKRRDSRSNSNSGSDTPPHLTIVDTSNTPPQQEFKTAPVLENALADDAIEKKWLPPVLEKSWTPPVLEKNWSLPVKEEPESDIENNLEPPKLEVGKNSSHKKSPSPPPKEEFITVIKTEVSPGGNNDSHPVVPPLIIKKIKPAVVASHLPKAITDPRMAKLHNRVDPRRHRLVASDTKSIVERKKQIPNADSLKTVNRTVNESKNEDIPETPKPTPVQETKTSEEKNEKSKVVKDEKAKIAKSIPKKRRLSDRSEEKKKTVHRNRKSSMDYASPLNSCDTTNLNSTLDYNSYNQRPKRNINIPNEKTSSAIEAAILLPELSDTSLIPDFVLSDSSNLDCDNSNDVNLKDKFKTIDPTASPFC